MIRVPDLLSDPVYHDEEAARLYLQEVALAGWRLLPVLRRARRHQAGGGASMGEAGSTARPARTNSRCASAPS